MVNDKLTMIITIISIFQVFLWKLVSRMCLCSQVQIPRYLSESSHPLTSASPKILLLGGLARFVLILSPLNPSLMSARLYLWVEEIKAEGFLSTMRKCVTKFSPVLSKKSVQHVTRKLMYVGWRYATKYKCYRLPVSILPLNISFAILQERLEIFKSANYF